MTPKDTTRTFISDPVSANQSAGGSAASEPALPSAATALPPGLYLVATPIGNLGDLSPRARDTLIGAATVYCEDTRVTARLLAASNAKRALRTYHEHNAEAVRPSILGALADGHAVALCSDAGTPLVSDPGFKLVREVREAGFPVIPIPGPSAPLAALIASGLPTDRFLFQGFLPPKQAAQAQVIAELAPLSMTLIFFESPLRAAATLEALALALGPRDAVLAREITKRFEEFRGGTLAELAESCRERPPRGEVVLVVAGRDAALDQTVDVDALLQEWLAKTGPSDAAKQVAKLTGRPRQELYKRALALRQS